MAISDNYVPLRQIGNGSTTQFSSNWDMVNAAYAAVFLESVATGVQTPQTQGVDYTLVFTSAGFTVTFTVAPTSSNYAVVGRDVSIDQTDPYTTSKGYQGATLEDSLDKLTAISQDLRDVTNRSVAAPLGDPATNFILPSALLRATHVLAFDAAGNVIVSDQTLAQIESGSTSAAASAAIAVAAASTATGAASTAVTAQGIAVTAASSVSYFNATGGGTANAQTFTTGLSLPTISAGMAFRGQPTVTNTTTTPTLAIDAHTALTIVRAAASGTGTTALQTGDIPTASDAEYYVLNGTTVQLLNPVTLPTQVSGGSLIPANMLAAQNQAAGYVNKFRNPNFLVNQRGTSGTVTTGNNIYTSDGWYLAATGATLNWGTGFNGNVGTSILNLACITGLTSTQLAQRIESVDAQQLAGKMATIQFTINNQTGASFTPQLNVVAPTVQDNYGSTSAIVTAQALQACPNNTVTTVAFNVLLSNVNVINGLQVQLNLGGALNQTAGGGIQAQIMLCDIRTANGAVAGLTSTPPNPEIRPYALEELWCRRFLNIFVGVINQVLAWGWATAANSPEFFIPLKVKMRTIPSLTPPTAGQVQANFQVMTAIQASNGNASTADIFSISGTTAAGITSGQGVGARWNGSAGQLLLTSEI